jgi:hypothetical protein
MPRHCVVRPFNYNNVCSTLYVHYRDIKTSQSLSTNCVSARTRMPLLPYMFMHAYVDTHVCVCVYLAIYVYIHYSSCGFSSRINTLLM